MSSARALWTTSLSFLGIGAAMATLGVAPLPGPYDQFDWGGAHAWLLLSGFLLPALYFLHLFTIGMRTGKQVDREMIVFLQGAIIAGTILFSAGLLIPDLITFDVTGFIAFVGVIVMLLTSVLQIAALRQVMPEASLVHPEDPLSKGDDACLKHIKMAHRMLPIGLLLLALGFMPSLGAYQDNFRMAGVHLVLVGYGVLSIYGLGHLLIPRFSGIPAIAAGAIKGELHTSLLGIVGITAGFLVGAETTLGRGLMVGLGPFVFLGMFIYMGVLGANIMKNKSKTQRVTPEFVYIPWTFTGIFWLVGAVLLGILVNAVPDALAEMRPGLRFTHLHAAAVGGIVLLVIGWSYRLLAKGTPPTFGSTRGPFFVINGGLTAMIIGALQIDESLQLYGAIAIVLGILWAFWSMRQLSPTQAPRAEVDA